MVYVASKMARSVDRQFNSSEQSRHEDFNLSELEGRAEGEILIKPEVRLIV